MNLMKTIVVMFLTCTTSMTGLAQSQGQTVDDPVAADSKATTRLFELCQDPDASPEAVASAIRDGADLKAEVEAPTRPRLLNNREVMQRRTAFQLAVMNARNPEVLEVLIDAGSTLTWRTVQLAAKHNSNPEVIAKLKASYAQVPDAHELNAINIFLEACKSNESVASIRWFLETQGADPNAPDSKNMGMTAFQAACGNNPNLDVIELLVDEGGILEATGRGKISPLMFAAMSNTPETTELLIKAGAKVNDRTQKGMSAYLYAALRSRYPDMFEVLVTNGANPNAMEYGVNAIEMSAAINQNPGIMTAIIAAGTRLPPLTKRGDSVLEWAFGNESPSVVEALMEAGVDPNPKNAEPPLLAFAGMNENPEVIQALLDAGADVNARSIKVDIELLEYKPFFVQGTTPLMLACTNISTEKIVPFITVFLEGGANVNDANQGGYTPLMFAVSRKYKNERTADVIRLLIEAGADPSARNKDGVTAREIAEANPALQRIDLDAAFQSTGSKPG
jgi:ankyrin repeat protein